MKGVNDCPLCPGYKEVGTVVCATCWEKDPRRRGHPQMIFKEVYTTAEPSRIEKLIDNLWWSNRC